MSKLSDVRPKAVKIMLDKERSLLYDLNAFALIEEAYDGVQNAMDALAQGSVKAMRCILWAGLVHEDEALTQKQVGAMVNLASMTELVNQINEAISQALPQPGKNAVGPPGK